MKKVFLALPIRVTCQPHFQRSSAVPVKLLAYVVYPKNRGFILPARRTRKTVKIVSVLSSTRELLRGDSRFAIEIATQQKLASKNLIFKNPFA